MKNCTYIYYDVVSGVTDKLEFSSYELLVDWIANNKIIGNMLISDDLYLESSTQDKYKMALTLIKSKNIIRAIPDATFGETAEESFEGVDHVGTFSVSLFIDSDYFTDPSGKRLVVPFNHDEFILKIIELLEPYVGKKEAEEFAKGVERNHKKIVEDANILHTILSEHHGLDQGLLERIKELGGERLEGVYKKLFTEMTTKGSRLSSLLFLDIKKLGIEVKVIKNLMLKAKTRGLDIKLLEHIDNIIIDSLGNVHVINYKISATTIDVNKRTKYRYEQAFLKLMLIEALQDEGINVRLDQIKTYIIPIWLKYDENFESVTDITIGSRERYEVDNRSRYVFEKYDNAVRKYISPPIHVEKLDREDFDRINEQLGCIFPEHEVSTQGIAVSAEMWISKNIGLRITLVYGKQGVYWQILFSDNDIVEIGDWHSPLENKKIIEEVKNRLDQLSVGNSYITAKNIADTVAAAMSLGNKSFSFSLRREYRGCFKYFDKLFKPYITSGKFVKVNGKTKFVQSWKLILDDVLLALNILLFENEETKQVDVVTISPYDLDLLVKFRSRYTNILGGFIGDNEARLQGIIPGTYGNIEMIRTMVSLNEILPKTHGQYKLGKIHVVSPENIGSSTIYTFKNAIRNFSKMLPIVRKNTPEGEFKIKNNFLGAKFIDSIEVFLTLLSEADEELYRKINDWGAEDLINITGVGATAMSDEARFEILKTIVKSMEEEFGFNAFDNLDVFENQERVMLYKAAMLALMQYSKLDTQIDYNEEDMSTVQMNAQGSVNIPSQNARIITGLFALTADTIAERAYKVSRPILKYLEEYYKAIGYSNLRNITIGDLQRAFRRLFEEIDGKRTMKFKNPYARESGLNAAESKFLKLVLFTLAKTRARMFPRNKDAEFNFERWDDPAIEEFMKTHYWYLEVPLMRASKATTRTTGYNIKEWGRRMKNLFSAGQLVRNYEELIDGIYGEDKKKIEEDFSRLSITNKYGWYESLNSESARQIALTKDPDFFETNVETLLMNFITGLELAEEMENFMIKAKAVLLTINGIGNTGSPRMKNTIKYIMDYLSINVYGRSVLEDSTKKLVSIIAPAKHLATSVYILGNLSSMVRDLTEGVLLNFVRAHIKFQTNISKKSLVKAYGIVVRDGTFTNPRTLNLLTLLNIKYRISNVDVARIEEVLASGRAGISNYENWLYATLRRPDFINRMTLLVARMIEDGVWGAMSVDGETGDLVYNWEEDERYKYYAEHRNDNPPCTDLKFLDLKGAYFSAILEYNLEHTDNPLNILDPNVALPSPYTNETIESIKAVGNSIYGSYDKSTRAMWEFMATGLALGQFTTWMNGMIGNYFRKPGTKTGETRLVQAEDETGQKLFLDQYNNIVVLRTKENGEVYYYNDDTDLEVIGDVLPLMKNVPVISQGIYYSVIHLFTKIIPKGLDEYKEKGILGLVNEINREIIDNPEELKNFKKLISDIIVTLFMGVLFKYVVDPAYKDLKKNRDQKEFLVNSFEDIVYRGTSTSYDGFKGPFNIITTYGSSNPPAYKVTTKMITDIAKTAFGDKTLGQLVTLNVPVFRSFRSAYDAYVK